MRACIWLYEWNCSLHTKITCLRNTYSFCIEENSTRTQKKWSLTIQSVHNCWIQHHLTRRYQFFKLIGFSCASVLVFLLNCAFLERISNFILAEIDDSLFICSSISFFSHFNCVHTLCMHLHCLFAFGVAKQILLESKRVTSAYFLFHPEFKSYLLHFKQWNSMGVNGKQCSVLRYILHIDCFNSNRVRSIRILYFLILYRILSIWIYRRRFHMSWDTQTHGKWIIWGYTSVFLSFRFI